MNKRVDPRKQFSKRLARYGAIVWGLFLFLVIILMFSQPEVAMSCVWLVLIVTVNKMVDTLAYTDNSKTEKFLLSALDRAKLELNLKGVASNSFTQNETDEEESSEEEEGDNG